jgi:hypothetical protein
MPDPTYRDVFKLVREIYDGTLRACRDVMAHVRDETRRPWSLTDQRRWTPLQSDIWKNDHLLLTPMSSITWRDDESEGTEIVLVQRYFSRLYVFEPNLMVAVTPMRVPKLDKSGYNLESALRDRKATVTPVGGAGSRLMDVKIEGGKTHPRFTAFAVSLDRLVDAEALRRRVVRPLVALLEGDAAKARSFLDVEDPARVEFVVPAPARSDEPEQVG